MLPDRATDPPYISVVLTGRNDGYGGEFVARFLATLQFNSRELRARGIPHEFVLVEWAPPSDVPLLAELVDARCPPPVATTLRTIVVDPMYQQAVTLNPRVTYQEYLAKNVGARRARGEYVVITNCDIFLGRRILERLERRDLAPGVIYRAPRWDLKEMSRVEPIDWEYLEDPGSLSGPPRAIRPPYFSGGAGDFIAIDRVGFEQLRGFNEVYRLVRIAIDGNFVVHAAASGLRIVDVGGPVYHIDHAGSYRTSRAQYVGRETDAPYGDERWPADAVVYWNRPTWGLAAAPERTLSPRRTYLAFSWDAVPPLVDLSRIVLPLDERPPDHPLGVADTADQTPLEVSLDRYRAGVREQRAVAAAARGTIERAAATVAEGQAFVRRRRRKAAKMAARRASA